MEQDNNKGNKANSQDTYLKYRRTVEDKSNILSKSDFRKINNLFNKKLIDRIIFDNFEFKIKGLGVLSLRKKKINLFKDGELNKKSLAIDWVETKKFNKIIYTLNEHTDGYRYFFRLDKYNFKNKHYYKFDISRFNRRYLAKILKNPDIYGKIDAYLN